MFFYENHLFGDENLYIANYLENFQFYAHFHRSFELVCVRSGEISIRIDDKTYKACAGDTVLIFPNQIHSFETESSSAIHLVIFSPEMVGRFASDYSDRVPRDNLMKNNEIAEAELMTKNRYLQKAVLYKALGGLTERTSFTRANIGGDFKLIHRMLSFVEENYAQNCTLKEVSAVLKYDYAYLSKQFIKSMNMSYTEYLNRFRISKACQMINRDDIPLSEVYASCGFENSRSFNRNFKRYTEITPSEFRNRRHTGRQIYNNMS